MQEKITTLLRRLCCGVIAHDQDLEIIPDYSGASLMKLSLRSHAADAPRIMGKGGARFKAFAFVVRCYGMKNGVQALLTTMREPVKGKPEPFPRFKFNPKWPKDEILKLVEDTCAAVFQYDARVTARESIGSCIIRIETNHNEQHALVEEATPHIQNIFNGIGVTHGCQLTVDIQ